MSGRRNRRGPSFYVANSIPVSHRLSHLNFFFLFLLLSGAESEGFFWLAFFLFFGLCLVGGPVLAVLTMMTEGHFQFLALPQFSPPSSL